LSKNITSLKEIKLTVNTMLKCGFLYNVTHPYIAVFRSITVIKIWIVSEGQKIQLFSQTCRRMDTNLKCLLFVEISEDET
jgi:hypothetical protein